MKKMSLSDILIPIGLACLVIWGMNTYFARKEEAPANSWTFIAPQQGSSIKPLTMHIDFLEERRKSAPATFTVETSWGIFDFTSEGGSLDSVAFKKDGAQNTVHRIYTVFPSDNKTDRFLLVALADKTPYYYDFAGKVDTQDSIEVSYRVATDSCTIEKTFIMAETKCSDL